MLRGNYVTGGYYYTGIRANACEVLPQRICLKPRVLLINRCEAMSGRDLRGFITNCRTEDLGKSAQLQTKPSLAAFTALPSRLTDFTFCCSRKHNLTSSPCVRRFSHLNQHLLMPAPSVAAWPVFIHPSPGVTAELIRTCLSDMCISFLPSTPSIGRS
jgi:hypothetical protein